MPRCRLCDTEFKTITNTHLKASHGLTVKEYSRKFPGSDLGMTLFPQYLRKDDPRYVKWKESLRGHRPWNKGRNKSSDETMKRVSLALRGRLRRNIQASPVVSIPPSADLAELVGITLGDGHLRKYERTEQLCISCNASKQKYVQHTAELLERVVGKAPSIYRSKSENVVRISVYQNGLSGKLQLPHGNKIKNNVGIPGWILENQRHLVRCLKGLFETDGCLSVHKKSYTTAIEFKNECAQLLADVQGALLSLGFAPQRGKNYVRLARKAEVSRFVDLVAFRS